MENSTDKNVMQATTKDGRIFNLTLPVLKHNVTLHNLYKDVNDEDDDEIVNAPITAVDGDAFAVVLEYSTLHQTEPAPKNDDENTDTTLSDADNQLFDKLFNTSKEGFFNVIKASNYLDNQLLLDNTCKYIANLLKGKTPEQIRETFDIENDLTPEQEEHINKVNQWCVEIN